MGPTAARRSSSRAREVAELTARASARALFGALVVLLAAALPAGAAGRETPLAVGAEMPDLVLPDHAGRTFRLSEALAERRFVVLAVFVKAFTGG